MPAEIIHCAHNVMRQMLEEAARPTDSFNLEVFFLSSRRQEATERRTGSAPMQQMSHFRCGSPISTVILSNPFLISVQLDCHHCRTNITIQKNV